MSISVTLLGTPSVSRDGEQISFPYRKAEGLFYYLCVKQNISRDEAVGIFWVDCSENAARKNLRDAVYHLKKLFGSERILVEGNNRIRLNMDDQLIVDYTNLTEENLIQCYTGDFLEFFYIKNCLEFSDWAEGVRAELLHAYQLALEKQAKLLARGHNAKALLQCGQLLLRKNVYDEDLFYSILSGLIRMGGYTEAEQLYQSFCEVLQRELGVEQDERFTALMQEAAVLRSLQSGDTSGANHDEYFYGRASELLALAEDITTHSVPAVLMTGEAGVGKTAILQKLRRLLLEKGHIVLSYQCVKPEEELYLKPWNDILEQAREHCGMLSISVSPALNIAEGQIIPSVFATQYELSAKSLLHALCEHRGSQQVVIVIDDVQWMDKESRRLLNSLIFWAKGEELSIIMASREPDNALLSDMSVSLKAKGLLHEMAIHRFTLDETERIISDCSPKLLAQHNLLDSIYRQTGGNALFLMESLKEIEYSGDFRQISAKMTGMIQSRLMNLPESERQMLNAVSLFPRFATIEDLEQVLGRPRIALLKDIEQLIVRQLIYPGSTYSQRGYGFSHQVIREYIYSEMLEDRRALLHGMVAEYYEQKYIKSGDIGLCPMLIYHFCCCGNIYKTYAYELEYLKTFYTVQHEIYPTFLTENGADDQPMPRLSGEDALVDLTERIRALHQSSPEADSLRMKAEFLLGRYDLFSGSFKKGLQNIAMSVSIAKKLNESRYLMDNYLQMAYHAIQIHDVDMLDHYITLSEELLDSHEYTEADRYTVMRLRGVYYMKKQQFVRAEEVFQKIAEISEALCRTNHSYRIGLAACYNYLGEIRQEAGKLDEALSYYLRAIGCCDEQRVVSGMGVMYSHAGYVLYQLQRLSEAQWYIDKAAQCFDKRDALWGRSEAMSCAALLDIERKDWTAAARHIASAREAAQLSGNPSAFSLVEKAEESLSGRQEQK